jgi:hypothetical protein
LRADEDDARQIRQLVDSWIVASKAHDLRALMGMMTDDVIFMTPGRAPFGKAEFAADVERMKGVAIDARAEVQGDRGLRAAGLRPQPCSGRADFSRASAEAYVGVRDERFAQGGRRPLAHRARRQPGFA